MSHVVGGALPPVPRSLRQSVTQRHIKAEVAHCVGAVMTPPCGVPVTDRRTCPSLITPARNIARRSLRTDWSLTRSCTARIKPSCGIASKEYTTYYWYRGLSVLGDRYPRSTSVSGQGVAGVGQDAPAWCGGVSCGVTRREQDVNSGGLHRCRCGAVAAGGGDGGVGRGLGAAGVGGGVVAATDDDRDRLRGGRYGRSGQGGPPCIRSVSWLSTSTWRQRRRR